MKTEDKLLEILRTLDDASSEEISHELRVNLVKNINEAINYAACYKIDVNNLKNEKEPLPYTEWKKQLNMQKIEDTIFKIGNEYKNINELLDMYKEYYYSF